MTADTDIVAERPAAKIRGLMNVSGTQDLKKAGIEINRKMLSELAISDSAAFAALVEKAKAAL